jgi:hypothetical protein
VHDYASYHSLHPCIAIMLVSHTYIIAIGHVEQGPEKTLEPAQADGVNHE